ncbi:pyrin and HIN domain-containing protein 1-like isoform X2 [Lemur catta]|uniref:pyrin and HIN domain-containing protein 1-like isoform X2 n=1 Tax=Lemur catta TaxID=9447 RepID=UPI001E266976|nr:pyrin and HIN domain-containing protein 1-like isoform X2 [Lemur catta]
MAAKDSGFLSEVLDIGSMYCIGTLNLISKMVDGAYECWKIVLLKGLEDTSVYQFRMIKFLLTSTLNLRKEMQEKYDKVQIANLMVDKFPRDTSVDKIIQLCKDMPALQHIAEILKKEKSKEKRTTPSEKSKQKEKGPTTPAPERKRSTSTSLTSEGTEVTPGPQKKKNTSKGKDGTKRIKVLEEQTQPPCPAGASTSRAMGYPSPPQTASAPPSTSGQPLENLISERAQWW